MSGIQPGGLALVVKGEDSGKCVVTEFPVTPGEIFKSPEGKPMRYIGNSIAWVCTGRIFSTNEDGGVDGWAIYGEDYLKPISGGDFSKEREQERKLEHV